MAFNIDPSSISPTQIEADLVAFLQAQPDSARWKDFFDSSVGKQVIKIVAGLGTFLEYNIVTARRETFLPYVVNRSSAVASSGTLGYSPFRGRNAVVSLTIVPNISSLLPRYSIIGTVKDKDLVLLEDTIFNAGVPNTFLAVVGDRLEETLIAATDTAASFRFTNNNMSQDVRVLLNDVEVSSSERILDLINQKFVVQSNVNGAVTVMYLNLDTFGIQYTIGDEIKVQYIELNNLSFLLSNIICDIGTITASSFDDVFQPVETLENIKINAPLFHETQYTIRGRDDYMKTFRLLDSNIVDTNYTDISPAVVQLTYVTDILNLFSQNQLNQFILQLSGFRPMGVEPPTVKHPRPVFLTLTVTIKLLNNTGNPSSEVDAIIQAKEGVLENEIIFADLEKELEDLTFTKIARIGITTTPWAASTTYVRGHHVTPLVANGKIYEMNDIVYRSGLTQPNFATGTSPFVDNKITWCEEPRALCTDDGLPIWQPSTIYRDTDYVVAAPIVVTGDTANANPTISNIVTTNIEVDMLVIGLNIPANTYVLSKTVNTLLLSNNATAAATGTSFTILLMKKFKVCDFINASGTSKEIQQLSFAPVANSGTYRLEYNGDPTVDLPYNATALDIQNALNALTGLSGVVVTGTYNGGGFAISFDGLDANQDQPELTLDDAGQNEVQCLEFDFVPTSGSFAVTFNGQNTAPMPFNVSAAGLKTELENLSNIGVGEVLVSGNVSPSKMFTITFVGGLGLEDQPQMTMFSNTLIAALSVTTTPSTTTQGVAATPGQNEKQLINFSLIPTTGQFKLNYEAVDTAFLDQTMTAGSLQTALEALSSIGVGNVTVTGSFASGFTVEFIGALALSNRNMITSNSNTLARAQNVSVTATSTQEGGGGFNEIQKIDFNYVPNLGTWKLRSDGSQYSTPILSPALTAPTLQTYLEGLYVEIPGDTNYTSTIVAGDTTLGDPTITNIATGSINPGMTVSGAGIQPGSIVLSKTVNTVLLDLPAVAPAPQVGVSLTFVDASPVITGIVTTDVEVGTTVTGTGIPASTTVLSKTINTVTLSNPVTAAGTGVTLTFTRNNVGDVTVSGNFTNGFVIQYNGTLANINVPILIVSVNTLTIDLPVSIAASETQQGTAPTAAVNEVQRLDFNKVPDSGTYVINFNGDDTTALNFNDNAGLVQIALELLPSIGVGNVTVTGNYVAGFVITFIAALAGANQPEVTITSSSLNNSTAPIVVTPCTVTQGRKPANDLFQGITPVVATITTTDDGSNPEPDWFSGAPIC